MATFRRFSQLTAATTIADTDIFAASQLSLDVTITAATIEMSEVDGGLVDSGNGFIAAGFQVGDQINISGFAQDVNNIYSATVTDVTAGVMQITVDESESSQDFVDEVEGPTVTVTKWETRRVSKLDLETYEPISPSEWTGGSGPPGTYSEALDELAARVNEVEAGGAGTYIIGSFSEGAPSASAELLGHIFTQSVTFPAGLTLSKSSALEAAATAQADCPIQKIVGLGAPSSIGTMRYAAASQTATFIFASDVTFDASDILRIRAPGTPDATLAGIHITLVGTR